MGFGRSCVARTRLFELINTPNGALRATAHRSFAASYSSPKNKKIIYFLKKMLSFRSEQGPPGAFIFPIGDAATYWATCTLLYDAALSWAIHCTLISGGEPNWSTLHPTKLCFIQLSYAAPYLSYAASKNYVAPFWAKLYPSELRCTLSDLRCALRATLHPLS